MKRDVRRDPPAANVHPDAQPVVDQLIRGAKSVLSRRFVGMYLYGSLAIGDFDPRQSDIDFLVATTEAVPERTLVALQEMHARVEADHPLWATPNRIEGSYIPRRALRRYDPADARHPRYETGQGLFMQRRERDQVINCYVVREHGIVVAGPDPKTLIDPIAPDDLRYAVWDDLRVWWVPMLDDPAPLLRRGYQAYAALTLCRMLYTLETGEVTSKPAAVAWALGALDPKWSTLIRGAAGWRRDTDFNQLGQTQSFIRFTWDACNASRQARGF